MSETDTSIHVDAAAAVHGDVEHPGDAEYVRIAVILALITGVEVAVYYIKALKSVLIPILIVLAVTKFTMVALFFMHLKFDSRLFRRLFVTGIILAIIVYTIALTSLHVFS
jgi:cytochrome c oxidase subunit IV